MSSLFWNPAEHRLRAAWRIIIIQLLFWAVVLGIDWLFIYVFHPWMKSHGFVAEFISARGGKLWLAGLTLLCLWFAARYIDRRPGADFGLHVNRRWWHHLILGLILGFGLTMLPALVFAWVGLYRIEYVGYRISSVIPLWIGASSGFVMCLLIGLWEEAIFRGHLMHNLSEGLEGGRTSRSDSLTLFILVVQALVFAIFHIPGDWDVGLWGFPIRFLLGLALGMIFYATGSLAVPIGLHAAYDFALFFFVEPLDEKEYHLFQLVDVSPESQKARVYVALSAVVVITLIALAWILIRLHGLKSRTPLAEYKSVAAADSLPPSAVADTAPPSNDS